MPLGTWRVETGAHVDAQGRWHAAERPGGVMTDVHVHVGLPKTGTSSIQAALDARDASLAEAGVLYPGGRHRAHRLAAYDLLGQRVQGDDADLVAGAFNSLVEEMAGYTGRGIVVSEEELGLARPRHARKLVRSLDHHRVYVLIGIRDMARTVVSAWQQDVVTGGTTTWRDFIASVRRASSERGACRHGVLDPPRPTSCDRRLEHCSPGRADQRHDRAASWCKQPNVARAVHRGHRPADRTLGRR